MDHKLVHVHVAEILGVLVEGGSRSGSQNVVDDGQLLAFVEVTADDLVDDLESFFVVGEEGGESPLRLLRLEFLEHPEHTTANRSVSCRGCLAPRYRRGPRLAAIGYLSRLSSKASAVEGLLLNWDEMLSLLTLLLQCY